MISGSKMTYALMGSQQNENINVERTYIIHPIGADNWNASGEYNFSNKFKVHIWHIIIVTMRSLEGNGLG